jgi:hypothetical protein
MRDLYPRNSGPGTFRMGPDGAVYRVPARGQSARRVTEDLPSPSAVPAPEDLRGDGSTEDLLKHLPQMGVVGGC